MRETQIRSDLLSVGGILKSEFRYFVPPYQRNFSWTDEEVEQIWSDIVDAIESDKPEYFLGSVVVHENRGEKKRVVIDGQQRLACLSMILSAIRTVYSQNADDRAGEVFQDYLGIKDRRSRITEPRLALNALNEPVFQRAVVEDISDADLVKTMKEEKTGSSNYSLCRAMTFFREVVRKRAAAASKYEVSLLKLEDFLRDSTVLILVRVDDEADAYLIFETLNDRGLELSISDLLKNYIFSRAGTSKLGLVRKQWEEMAFLLGNQGETQFLRHYWLSRYGVVRERDLYKAIKKKFSTQSSCLDLMSELREASDKYSAISNPDHSLWKEGGTGVRRDLEALQLFSLSQFRPLLLAALDSLTPDEIAKLLKVIIVVSMRYSLIESLGTGNIEGAYSDAAIAVRSSKANTAAKIFNLLKGIFPDDERFREDFAFKSVSKPKLARYMLREIANLKEGSKARAILDDEKAVDLEHIMPKQRNDKWKSAAADEEQYRLYVDRLGNLTLIERAKNKAAGAAPFAEKKAKAYSLSEIQLTKEICSESSWTASAIDKRQKDLAALAVKAWRLPY